jgi:hypothetical protein
MPSSAQACGKGEKIMFDFNNMLNWKLKAGSHKFPGPDGGTCINEAAVVAAGLQYRRVDSADDLPDCFSRPIAQFALRLNDVMPAKLRQKYLMPFILRLADSADEPEIELKRTQLIIRRCVQNIFPLIITDLVVCRRCRQANTTGKLVEVIRYVAASETLMAKPSASTILTVLMSNCPIKTLHEGAIMRAVDAASAYVQVAADRANRPTAVFGIAARMIDEALRIGKQANRADVAAAALRLSRARQGQKSADRMQQIELFEKAL